ncbi:hypothetical protein D7Z54_30360 [Salibacterium salarium]|uniref:Uncharacterized protein n=1 Tax=Salibacterium salarium TaxID=284579 RepID=A0A3R9PY76_9BACI|nr:hypothetical protein [Salibacterium salarium]RSL29599.1 hypothetical protein D7Z54_30360 [Salibacterium salarium]
MKKRVLIIGGVLFAAIVISGFFIPVQLSAPPDVRTIVDHTNQIYVSPTCFNDAQLSNYLQESDLGEAQQLNYNAESDCTRNSLVEKDVTLNIALLKMLGVVRGKWSSDVWEKQ